MSTIKQCQSTLEGRLTLMNSTNVGNQFIETGLILDDDIRSSYSNTINYNIFTSPEAPSIRLLQNGEEISSINLDRSPNITTNVEIISPHPITLFKGSSVINSSIYQFYLPAYFERNVGVTNYVITKDIPIFSTDGYYHYTIHLRPTETNSFQNPIKLGDLSIVSRIHDVTWRSEDWIRIIGGSEARSQLRTLLRVSDDEVDSRIVNLSGGTLPSQIKNIVPGTAFKFGNNSDYYVIPDYGLVKEVSNYDSFDYISNDSKYYYQQQEIDNTFGVSDIKVSVIQNGDYYYRMIRTGSTSNLLNFAGGTRTFIVQKVDTTSNEIIPYAGYKIFDILNCNITRNGGDITMVAPPRTSKRVDSSLIGYSPYDLSADSNFYTTLVNDLPVFFNVKINTVESGNMEVVGNCLQLPGGSSAGKSILNLSSKPTEGTSGLNRDFDDYYYRDEITSLYKYIPILETYEDSHGLKSLNGFIPIVNGIRGTQGFTTKISVDWNLETVAQKDIPVLLSEKKLRFGNSATLTGYDSSSVLMPSSIPVNTDDFLIAAEPWNYTPQSDDNVTDIYVDNIPDFIAVSFNNDIIRYIIRGDHAHPSGQVKIFKPKVTNSKVKVLTPNCEWSNFKDIKHLYHYMNVARNTDGNGYYWKSEIPFEMLGSSSTVPMSDPNDWNSPTGPAVSANYNSYGDSYYLWARQTSAPSGDVEEVASLPLTRGEAGTSYYKYVISGTTYYYHATNSFYICDISDHYSIVALNKSPEDYDPNKVYMRGDLIRLSYPGVYVYVSNFDNNIGHTPPANETSNSYWGYVGDIKEYTNSTLTTNPVNYKYYKVNINKFPDEVTSTMSNTLPQSVTSSSHEYFGKLYNDGTRVETYYRKGYDFQIGTTGDGDHGIWKTSGGVNTLCTNRIFKVVIYNNPSAQLMGSTTYYYQLKSFAVEAVLPDNFTTAVTSSTRVSGGGVNLKDSNLPGNIILKGDTEGCGFGIDNNSILSTNLLYDFNQYIVKHPVFDEDVEYTQESTTNGLVSNFGMDSSNEYKLYLGENNQNTIEVSLESTETSYSGFIGSYSLQSKISSAESGVGDKPLCSPHIMYNGDVYHLNDPVLDGNNTPNFTLTFPENTGGQDLLREFHFSISDGRFVSKVILKIIQEADPGQVIPAQGESRSLYFLSNGIPYTTFEFSSDIQGLSLQNIQVLNNYGEDILDRDENGAYLQELNHSTTFSSYSAFLKLKPNTRHEVFNGFRIKIGRVIDGSVTDRTLDENTARFYKLVNSGWTLLDNTFKPTYKEPYYESLPNPSQFNNDDVICVCSSLRGYQGYYTTYLYDLGYESGRPIYYDLIWKEKSTLREVVEDLVTLDSYTITDNFLNTLNIITTEIELPDINTMTEVGVIYKIEDTFYYTFANRIMSGYTYGTVNLPNYISSSGSNSQKYHLEVLQREYDSSGSLSEELDVHELLSDGRSYTISDPNYLTTWELLDSDIPPHELEGISSDDTCSGNIIFSDTQSPTTTPYFIDIHDFYNGTPPILVKTNLRLKLKYNNLSGISMDEEYRWVKYLFTLYTKWSNS